MDIAVAITAAATDTGTAAAMGKGGKMRHRLMIPIGNGSGIAANVSMDYCPLSPMLAQTIAATDVASTARWRPTRSE